MADLVSDLLRRVNDAERIARINAISRGWDAYFNRLPDALTVGRDDPDDNMPLPLAQVIVDAGRSALMGKDLPFNVVSVGGVDVPKPSPNVPSSPAQEYLDAVWDQNHRPTFLHAMAMNGGVAGHVFVKMIQRPDSTIRLVNLDPINVDVQCDEDDFQSVYSFIIDWVVERTEKADFLLNRSPERKIVAKRQLITKNDNGQSWTITDQESVGDSPTWSTVATETWNRPWPPIFHCQNLPSPNEFFGMSDIEPGIIGLIEDLNFLMGNSNRIVRFHGHPKVWFNGVSDPGSIDWSPDEALGLPEGASVNQLVPTADLTQILSLYNEAMNVFHQATRVPRVALGQTEAVGPVPGVTLKILYQPLTAKTEDKQRLYGDLFDDLNEGILDLGGFGPDCEVDTPWQDPVPSDPLYDAQAAAAQETAGVSKDTALQRMGFDPEAEREGRTQDQNEAGAALMAAQNQFAGGG